MPDDQTLSPWWRRCAIVTIVVCFCVLGWLAKLTYSDAPPIPERVVGPDGAVLFTAADVAAGQQVFLRYGLMENGTIWGHGAYLGPDFSAQYLHTLAIDSEQTVSERHGFVMPAQIAPNRRLIVNAEVTRMLKRNRYDPASGTLTFTEAEAASYQHQIALWTAYFTNPSQDAGLPRDYISDPAQLRELTSFFAWAAWASVANRPGLNYSYTNNFPYDPSAGNLPTSGAVLWSALSVITLLGATAAVLFAFGRFDFLGWRRQRGHVHPKMLAGVTTPSQRATIKYFAVIALLFLAQALVGGGTAHYRANSGSFYGFNLSAILPSQILRTWHLQLAIFWIAASYVAGGLFLAPVIGGAEPRGQARWVNVLFAALVLVVVGSLLGEFAGVHQWFGRFWSWFGDQGWEYLDLGRAWQMMLAAGLALWVVLLYRAIAPRLSGHESSELSWLFIAAAVTIPVFYVPAFFYNTATNFTIVDLWRFWIIHLWVENFLRVVRHLRGRDHFLSARNRLEHDRRARRLSRRAALSRRRDHRHRASLVLHRPGADCDGAELGVLGDGGRATHAADARRVGFHRADPGAMRYLRRGYFRAASMDILLPDGGWSLELSSAPACSASLSICRS